jgi:hypothetical protein
MFTSAYRRARGPQVRFVLYKQIVAGWWHTLVVLVTWETEAGGSLEPRSPRPAWII